MIANQNFDFSKKDEKINNNTVDIIEEGRQALSAEEISKYQSRIKHFLNSFEFENNLNGIDVAKMLGYTNAHYSRLKNIGVENKISSTLNFLSNLAKLKNMSLTEFIIYVENKPLSDPEKQLKRGLWDWEIETINFLSKIEPTIRRIITRKFLKESDKSRYSFLKIEIAFSVLLLIVKLEHKDFKLMITILKELLDRNEDKFLDDKNSTDNKDILINLEELNKNLILLSKSIYIDKNQSNH